VESATVEHQRQDSFIVAGLDNATDDYFVIATVIFGVSLASEPRDRVLEDRRTRCVLCELDTSPLVVGGSCEVTSDRVLIFAKNVYCKMSALIERRETAQRSIQAKQNERRIQRH
jgi:hypothetical protein